MSRRVATLVLLVLLATCSVHYAEAQTHNDYENEIRIRELEARIQKHKELIAAGHNDAEIVRALQALENELKSHLDFNARRDELGGVMYQEVGPRPMYKDKAEMRAAREEEQKRMREKNAERMKEDLEKKKQERERRREQSNKAVGADL